MGILDKKSRIVDTIITPIGRNNLSQGNINIRYYTLTDADSLYLSSSNNINDRDTFKEFILETSTSFNDEIFFATNSEGKNFKFVSEDYIVSENGKVFNAGLNQVGRSTHVTGSNGLVTTTNEDGETVTISSFSSIAGTIISSSFKSIVNKSLIRNTQNNEFNEFKLNKKEKIFYVSNENPIRSSDISEIDVNTAEPMFFDKFVSNVDKFKFMPPVYPSNINSGGQIGSYTDLNQTNISSFSDIESMLSGKQSEQFNFDKTSKDSNIVMQMFELVDTDGSLIKLDTLDFGEYLVDNEYKKVIFCGKIFIDDYGYPTYVNLFSIVMEE